MVKYENNEDHKLKELYVIIAQYEEIIMREGDIEVYEIRALYGSNQWQQSFSARGNYRLNNTITS